MHTVTTLLNQYGYIVLFAALALELLAFPLPGEALMGYCGVLIFQGKLNWILSIIAASAGAAFGITASYWIGRLLGIPFFRKYGHYVHLGPDKIENISSWFERFGNKLLILAYFIPGVRHITGYFSGITKISYSRFALNAYIGSILWTSTFISLGKVLGPKWELYSSYVKKYLIIGSIIFAIILTLIYILKKYKTQIAEAAMKNLNQGYKIFNSMGKMKVAAAFVVLVFIGLSFLMIGIIQDYLANEFSKFDSVVSLIVQLSVSESIIDIMMLFTSLASYKVIIPICALLIIWVTIQSKEKFLDFRFIVLIIFGGEVIEELLRRIFRRTGPYSNSGLGGIQYSFPSENTFMAVVLFGLILFYILRLIKNLKIKKASVILIILLLFSIGISSIYLMFGYPSDIMAGYVFGSVWLMLNIILLEINRILPKLG